MEIAYVPFTSMFDCRLYTARTMSKVGRNEEGDWSVDVNAVEEATGVEVSYEVEWREERGGEK